MKLTAKATRVGKWWAIEVPEIDGLFTQTKRLDQIETMVKDAASLLTETPETDFEVSIVVTNPKLQETATNAIEADMKAKHATEIAATQTIKAIKQLLSFGLPVRDVATMLKISPARVSQINKAA